MFSRCAFPVLVLSLAVALSLPYHSSSAADNDHGDQTPLPGSNQRPPAEQIAKVWELLEKFGYPKSVLSTNIKTKALSTELSDQKVDNADLGSTLPWLFGTLSPTQREELMQELGWQLELQLASDNPDQEVLNLLDRIFLADWIFKKDENLIKCSAGVAENSQSRKLTQDEFQKGKDTHEALTKKELFKEEADLKKACFADKNEELKDFVAALEQGKKDHDEFKRKYRDSMSALADKDDQIKGLEAELEELKKKPDENKDAIAAKEKAIQTALQERAGLSDQVRGLIDRPAAAYFARNLINTGNADDALDANRFASAALTTAGNPQWMDFTDGNTGIRLKVRPEAPAADLAAALDPENEGFKELQELLASGKAWASKETLAAGKFKLINDDKNPLPKPPEGLEPVGTIFVPKTKITTPAAPTQAPSGQQPKTDDVLARMKKVSPATFGGNAAEKAQLSQVGTMLDKCVGCHSGGSKAATDALKMVKDANNKFAGFDREVSLEDGAAAVEGSFESMLSDKMGETASPTLKDAVAAWAAAAGS